MLTVPPTAVSSTPAAFVADSTPSAQFAAETALFELCGHVRALRLGLAPFDVLTPEERAEQLNSLLLGDDEPAPDLSALSSDELIALVGLPEAVPHVKLVAALREIDRRLAVLPQMPAELVAMFDPGDGSPDAGTRQVIEDEDFLEHQERTMKAERTFTLDAPLHGRTGWAEDGDAFNGDFAG